MLEIRDFGKHSGKVGVRSQRKGKMKRHQMHQINQVIKVVLDHKDI